MREIIAVFHNVRSLHNVGSMFRTADAAGIKKIYLTGITPIPSDRFGKIRPQLQKVSLGAEQSVLWEQNRSATPLIKKLKRAGYKIYAIEQSRRSTPYFKARPRAKEKIALIFGNEVKGLPLSLLRQADKILEIPMRGQIIREAGHPRRTGSGKESLNVSVAFGIVVYALSFPNIN